MQDHLIESKLRHALREAYPALDEATSAWEAVTRAARDRPVSRLGEAAAAGMALHGHRADLPPYRRAPALARLRQRLRRHRRSAVAHRRRWAFAAVLAAAVAAVITLPGAFREEHFGSSSAAAAALERAAKAATAYDTGHDGRYAYTKAETLYAAISTDPKPYTLLLPSVRETWVARDGSGRVVETRKQPLFPGPRDRERWQADGSSQPPRTRIDERIPPSPAVPHPVLATNPEDLTLVQLDRWLGAVPQLPTDPRRLQRVIRAYAEKKDPPLEAQMFNVVSDLLNSPYASAELRAAAYRVLARINGVGLEGERRDPIGRRGIAISAPAGYGSGGGLNQDEQRLLIIDPSTGNVLAEETTLMRRVPWIDARLGTVTGSITILDQGWVDSVDQRPPPNP